MTKLEGLGYSIEIGSLLESSIESFVKTNYAQSKIVILVDDNTHEHCLSNLIANFDVFARAEVMLIPAGEENKVIDICIQVWEALSDYEIGRKDLIINLGGGLVTDMGGFIASIFKRGVDFIHVPTTLLGMVDASIGGKNGVDLDSYKNQLGVIQMPKAIYVDTSFLETLEDEEIVNGLAEMLKHALISDKDLWEELKEIDDLSDLYTEELLSEVISIKLNVVNEDPTEKNKRKILNFGHTIGHALEGHFLFKNPISHGHAVAMGMIAESYISFKMNLLSEEEFKDIANTILQWFPIPSIQMDDIDNIVSLLYNDKKNHSGKIQTCLLEAIGSCIYDQSPDDSLFTDAILYLITQGVSKN
jgi:3-dehydroquinate synthase